MLEFLAGILWESLLLLGRMAPYLLFGIAVAGVLHVLLPVGSVARHIGGRGLGPVFKAAAVGVPLPLCSCGVVPVAASLKRSGASDGAVVSFLISTPITGVDSILATYSLLGWVFAIARILASFFIGLFAGAFTNIWANSNTREPEKFAAGGLGVEDTRGNWAVRAAAYGLGELLGGIAGPLALGTLLGGAISYILPPNVLEIYMGRGLLPYLVMMAVGIPMYVCASGSLPLAAALLAKGISPGAALVFLITGPASNAASIAMISRMLGKRVLAIYLGILAAGSLLAGMLLDAFFARFPALLPEAAAAMSHHHAGMPGAAGLSDAQIACAAILSLLVLYHLVKRNMARLGLGRKEVAMGMTTLKVEDMTCQNCARAIANAVCAIPGVRDVKADPATKLVSLDLDDGADEQAITEAIAKAGFHPKPVGE